MLLLCGTPASNVKQCWETEANDKPGGASIIRDFTQLSFQYTKDDRWNASQQAKPHADPSVVLRNEKLKLRFGMDAAGYVIVREFNNMILPRLRGSFCRKRIP